MFSKQTSPAQEISTGLKQLEDALFWGASIVIRDLDSKAKYLGMHLLAPEDLYSIETRNDSPPMPLPYHSILIKCGLLHDHFWKYFTEVCKLPMTHLLRDMQVEEKDLREHPITDEQIQGFVGSFEELIKSHNNTETVEQKTTAAIKPRF